MEARLETSSQHKAAKGGSGEIEKTSSTPPEATKWAQIYSYSYNESLTGCVEQLEELEKYTKVIVGELG